MQIAIVDVETTGLVPRDGGITELAVQVFDSQTMRVVADYASLNDPGCEIPERIQELTDISPAMVKGESIDWRQVSELLLDVALVTAHRASFDRAWIEAKGTGLPVLRWACSKLMIDWIGYHCMPHNSLEYLAFRHGLLCCCPEHVGYNGPQCHRAGGDVDLLRRLLWCADRNPKRAGRTYLDEMLEAAAEQWCIVRACGAPFECKDALREGGFSWSAPQRVWWKLERNSRLPELKAWMIENAYLGDAGRASTARATMVDPTEPDLEVRLGLREAAPARPAVQRLFAEAVS